MRHPLYPAACILLTSCAVAAILGAQEALPPEATLASVAHSRGVRGGDLAEALGLPRGTDKDKPLVQMGIAAAQVQEALAQLAAEPPPPTAPPEAPEPLAELPADATLASIAHANGVRGGDLAEALGLPRATDKERPLSDLGITAPQVRKALARLEATPAADLSMSLREIAQSLDMNERELAKDLLLSVDVDNTVPLAELGVRREQLDKAIAHHLSETHARLLPAEAKYPIYALIVLFALAYLLKLGVPSRVDPKQRRRYYPQWVYVLVLLLSVAALGFLLGKSPNPMEGAVKVFKASVGLYESVWAKLAGLLFFLVLAVVANKVVCGWACPFGALEELLYTIPLFRRAKRWQLPFWVSNSIRILLFVGFLLILYGLVGDKKGLVTYHYMNPFNLFNFDFSISALLYLIPAYLVISLFFYRPFCRFICPFGLISWVCERVSLTRIRIDRERCIDCGACATACPLTAAADRLAGCKLPADCFSCMRCLRVCPTDAIHYRPAWGPPSPPAQDPAEDDRAA
jgi:ferredoxin